MLIKSFKSTNDIYSIYIDPIYLLNNKYLNRPIENSNLVFIQTLNIKIILQKQPIKIHIPISAFISNKKDFKLEQTINKSKAIEQYLNLIDKCNVLSLDFLQIYVDTEIDVNYTFGTNIVVTLNSTFNLDINNILQIDQLNTDYLLHLNYIKSINMSPYNYFNLILLNNTNKNIYITCVYDYEFFKSCNLLYIKPYHNIAFIKAQDQIYCIIHTYFIKFIIYKIFKYIKENF